MSPASASSAEGLAVPGWSNNLARQRNMRQQTQRERTIKTSATQPTTNQIFQRQRPSATSTVGLSWPVYAMFDSASLPSQTKLQLNGASPKRSIAERHSASTASWKGRF